MDVLAASLLVLITLSFTLVAAIVYSRFERHNRYSVPSLLLFIVLGLISAGLAIILSELFYYILDYLFPFTSSDIGFIDLLIFGPILEELSKLVVIYYLLQKKYFTRPLGGLIIGGFVGIGFALSENLLYVFVELSGTNLFNAAGLAFFRGALQIIGHPLYGALIGYGLGSFEMGLTRSKFGKVYNAVLIHILWNIVGLLAGIDFFFFSLGLVVTIAYLGNTLRFIVMKAQDLETRVVEQGL